MTELLQKPEVMRKACNELEQAEGLDSVVEEFHLAKLPNLEVIVKETLPRVSTRAASNLAKA